MEHIIKNLKVVGFYNEGCESNGIRLEDENGVEYALYSYHEQDCCEVHYLAFGSLELSEFEGLLFDFDTDDLSNYIERVEGSGIRLKPNNGHPIFIPGYSSNNGFYSDDITLVFCRYGDDDVYCQIDVTECQPEY